ncbi:MAG: peptidoglycan editing factor PgeF [Bacillota bacterium]|jgi:YfiH family protein|nr:peptidoglycan editing factor PgeF [Bacillota bacterium]HHU30124.1 peptidoglycan editing factor PgeF [Bacillota bacterium]
MRKNKETVLSSSGIYYLNFSNLQKDGLLHGFTLRAGGVSPPPYDSLNLGLHVGDRPENVHRNRRLLAKSLGFAPEVITSGCQVHGTVIREVGAGQRGLGHATMEDALPETDGLLTAEPGVVLASYAADCAVLFYFDPEQRWVGLAHAGWRGAVLGMGALMVESLVQRGCRREDLCVAVSPAIGFCCYEVGEEVVAAVDSRLHRQVFRTERGKVYFNLSHFLCLQLTDAGISKNRLFKSCYCTSCRRDMFYSYRAAGGRTGRMAGVIALLW